MRVAVSLVMLPKLRLAAIMVLALVVHFVTTPVCSRKIYAAGSGQAMMSLSSTAAGVISLSGKTTPRVLYLGTASYDQEDAQQKQTQAFISAGCQVSTLAIAVKNQSVADMKTAFDSADIVLVSGGNTLYALNRWAVTGVDKLLWEAMKKGTVMSGGSAGGIVWFDGGHSDSMDPTSYKNPPGPWLNPSMSTEDLKNWAYIRVAGLGMLPGLFGPHYDTTGSNGVVRATDFTTLLQRHSAEIGLGVDNYAALVVDGDIYYVVSTPGYTGSVDDKGAWTPGPPIGPPGTPGAWRMSIDSSGRLLRTLIPAKGKVTSLFIPARYIVQDSQLAVAARQNPDDGIPPQLQRSTVIQ
eukprot:gb/GEZN01005738.1/.p1 GENE.gb/GEZN01005738.1/~~gb/GEZN01005738.1/.p1  ORF type:complete len:369 (+),score=38.98 gb/GEZN01005738.1/:53-1108(+)